MRKAFGEQGTPDTFEKNWWERKKGGKTLTSGEITGATRRQRSLG